ncbi:MAG: hypothetical protein UT32_C0006G0035 [Parcubacteria group bacterium GW2011_GWC2_39_14]|nr:MAG: hypothetical protein UT32_C0006G0035 [Parcubacteria group bacterium GW2011_GWC2_39_14]KKR54823.1 MAG: hypothetical protein UT91_C0009G0035 [Parcubacteria group bacterium GW2011_GWA2_40_23]
MLTEDLRMQYDPLPGEAADRRAERARAIFAGAAAPEKPRERQTEGRYVRIPSHDSNVVDDVPSAQRCARKGRPGIPQIKLYIYNDQGIPIGICA